MCARRTSGGGIVGAVDGFGLRRRRFLSKTSNSLDVVAGDWRFGHRPRRIGFPASFGSWVRHDRRIAARKRDDEGYSRRAYREMVYLGCFAWIGNVGRRFSAAAHDGGCIGRARGDVLAQ